jgi:hypothetical protein
MDRLYLCLIGDAGCPPFVERGVGPLLMNSIGSWHNLWQSDTSRRFHQPVFSSSRISPIQSTTQSLALWMVAAWLGGCASAGPAPTEITTAPSGIAATAADTSDPSEPPTLPEPSTADIESIRAMIRADGSARVIISLNVAFTPEGNLPDDAAVQAQRSAIAAAQADVIKGLSATNAVVVMQSKFTPTMIVVIDEAGLDWLAQSPLVAHIKVDSAIPPAGPTL